MCSASFPPSLHRALIDKDVSIAPESFRKHVDASLTYINRALKQMSHLFLVEDLVDSLKVSSSELVPVGGGFLFLSRSTSPDLSLLACCSRCFVGAMLTSNQVTVGSHLHPQNNPRIYDRVMTVTHILIQLQGSADRSASRSIRSSDFLTGNS